MKALRLSLVCAALFAASAAAPNDSLRDLLARMDRAASSFQGMSARAKYISYTVVLDDKSQEEALIRMRKMKGNEVQALVDFLTEPNKRTVAFEHSKVQIYYPEIHTVQNYDVGKQGEQIDEFFLIGFGASGSELAKSYDMRVLGSDAIAGNKTTRLELVPKAPDVRKILAKAELWIPDRPSAPYPIQEKLYEPSGNYRQINYIGTQINPQPPLTESQLKLNVPKGVKQEYPQRQ